MHKIEPSDYMQTFLEEIHISQEPYSPLFKCECYLDIFMQAHIGFGLKENAKKPFLIKLTSKILQNLSLYAVFLCKYNIFQQKN